MKRCNKRRNERRKRCGRKEVRERSGRERNIMGVSVIMK